MRAESLEEACVKAKSHITKINKGSFKDDADGKTYKYWAVDVAVQSACLNVVVDVV